MKFRGGFVSNSSSCAFILMGVQVKGELLKKFNAFTDAEKDDLSDVGYRGLSYRYVETGSEGMPLLGVYHSLDTDDAESLMTLDVEKEVNKVKEVLGEDSDVKVYYGIRRC